MTIRRCRASVLFLLIFFISAHGIRCREFTTGPLRYECWGGVAGIRPGQFVTLLYPDRVVLTGGKIRRQPGLDFIYQVLVELLHEEKPPACRSGEPVPDDMTCVLKAPDGTRQRTSLLCPPGRALQLWNLAFSDRRIDIGRIAPLVQAVWSLSPGQCKTERRIFRAEGASFKHGTAVFQVFRQGRWQRIGQRPWFRLNRVILIAAPQGPTPEEVLVLSFGARSGALHLRVWYPSARADRVYMPCPTTRK